MNNNIFERYKGKNVLIEVDPLRGTSGLHRTDTTNLKLYIGKITEVDESHIILENAITFTEAVYDSRSNGKKEVNKAYLREYDRFGSFTSLDNLRPDPDTSTEIKSLTLHRDTINRLVALEDIVREK